MGRETNLFTKDRKVKVLLFGRSRVRWSTKNKLEKDVVKIWFLIFDVIKIISVGSGNTEDKF